MPATVVVGLQFGDEGKGKIVDLIAGRYEYVARYNGGANAGHTVVLNGKKYTFHLLPSGALRGKRLVICAGVTVDPVQLVEELEQLEELGYKPNLYLDPRASLVMPWHKARDAKDRKIGTTKRGIGPSYADKVSRTNLRVLDLNKKLLIYRKFKEHRKEIEADRTIEELKNYLKAGEKLGRFMADTSELLNAALTSGKYVLFEGAQGTFLDINFGTYPYVTSSSTIAGGACSGCGIPPRRITKVIGVAKAYTTRVGKGPFPTEIHGNLAGEIRRKGNEYGSTTGRARRIGWLDLVMLRYAVMINGVREIALTKLDVLSGLDEIKVAEYYEYRGSTFFSPPADVKLLARVKPVYRTFEGWRDVSRVRAYSDLPANARKFIEYIEEKTGTRVSIISVGPDRRSTILRD